MHFEDGSPTELKPVHRQTVCSSSKIYLAAKYAWLLACQSVRLNLFRQRRTQVSVNITILRLTHPDVNLKRMHQLYIVTRSPARSHNLYGLDPFQSKQQMNLLCDS